MATGHPRRPRLRLIPCPRLKALPRCSHCRLHFRFHDLRQQHPAQSSRPLKGAAPPRIIRDKGDTRILAPPLGRYCHVIC